MSEILTLPTNKIPLTSEEKEMIEWLFPEKQKAVVEEAPKEMKANAISPKPMRTSPTLQPPTPPPSSSLSSSTYLIYLKIFAVILLFYMFNLPKIDQKIRGLFFSSNPYLSTALKTVVFYTILFSMSYIA